GGGGAGGGGGGGRGAGGRGGLGRHGVPQKLVLNGFVRGHLVPAASFLYWQNCAFNRRHAISPAGRASAAASAASTPTTAAPTMPKKRRLLITAPTLEPRVSSGAYFASRSCPVTS